MEIISSIFKWFDWLTVLVFTGNNGIESELENGQDVAYYEVALGTDRRYPHTRDNIVPFTNVGKNKSVTFTNLDLVPGHAIYYFTVQAYSASYTTALATSNGFYVSFEGGVEGMCTLNIRVSDKRSLKS